MLFVTNHFMFTSYCQDNVELARTLAEASIDTFVGICADSGILAEIQEI